MDRSVVPPKVHHLHYVFEDWLGDDLLAAHPCFIMTAHLAEKLSRVRLTGYRLSDVEISQSESFQDLNPDRNLPDFKRLDVTGVPGKDDFVVGPTGVLVVSERARQALRVGTLRHCDVSPVYEG